MKYYKTDSDDKIICQLCSHYCKLKNNQIGLCGVNKNINGRLKNLVYGYVAALNIDPIEKKPLYHLLPNSKALSLGTVGCNFQCPFCQNWSISQEKNIDKSTKISSEQIVELALEHGCESIAYTYNEPTVFYPFAKDIGLNAKQKGLKNIFVSNGFESKEMIEDMANWVDAVNIDFKSWDSDYYKKVLKAKLEDVKQSAKMMLDFGIWIEITTLLIEGENDSDEEIEGMADFIAKELGLGVPWHLSAFHGDYKMINHPNTSLQTLKRAQKIAKKAGLHHVYLGNVLTQADTVCPNCAEVLIKRDRYIVDKNRLTNGVCPKCGRKLEGVWS